MEKLPGPSTQAPQYLVAGAAEATASLLATAAAKTESANIIGSLSKFKDSLGAKLTVSDQNVAISHLNTICLNMNPPLPTHGGIFRRAIGSNEIEIFDKKLFVYLCGQPTTQPPKPLGGGSGINAARKLKATGAAEANGAGSAIKAVRELKATREAEATGAAAKTESANITGSLSEFKGALGATLTVTVSDQNVAISHLKTICLTMNPPLPTHGGIFRRATGPNEIEICNKRLFDHLFDLPTIQSPSTKHDTSGDSDMRRVLRNRYA